jgi:HK97 family phage prohead protease
MKRTKSYGLTSFKAVGGDAPQGTFEAIVSVFGVVDLVGDRVVLGAFDKSLQRWRDSGDPIPVIWSHEWDDPFKHIGSVVEAEELAPGDARLPAAIKELGGLWISGAIDVDENPLAKQVWGLLNARRVKEFSFAYDIPKGGERRASDGATDLVELELIEVGPTLKGANQFTQLIGAKEQPDPTPAAGAKATVALAGSLEQKRAELLRLVREWAVGLHGGEVYWATIEATFDDHVVAYVELWEDPYDGGRYYSIPYSSGEEGFELDTEAAAEVAIEGAVVPKQRPARGLKEGRRNSTTDNERIQSIHDLTVELGIECAAADPDDDKSGTAPAKGKPEDPSGKGEDPTQRTPAAVRIAADIELVEL